MKSIVLMSEWMACINPPEAPKVKHQVPELRFHVPEQEELYPQILQWILQGWEITHSKLIPSDDKTCPSSHHHTKLPENIIYRSDIRESITWIKKLEVILFQFTSIMSNITPKFRSWKEQRLFILLPNLHVSLLQVVSSGVVLTASKRALSHGWQAGGSWWGISMRQLCASSQRGWILRERISRYKNLHCLFWLRGHFPVKGPPRFRWIEQRSYLFKITL